MSDCVMCVSKVNPVVATDDGTSDNGGVVNDPHYRQGNLSYQGVAYRQ